MLPPPNELVLSIVVDVQVKTSNAAKTIRVMSFFIFPLLG